MVKIQHLNPLALAEIRRSGQSRREPSVRFYPLALHWQIGVEGVGKGLFTGWASSGWRLCEEVEGGLSERWHAGLWRRPPGSFFPSRWLEAAGLEEGVGYHRHRGMSV